MYQKSEQHIKNLNDARTKAINTKVNCIHCEAKMTKGGITRHEKYCYLNPINIKLCPVCDEPIKNFKENTTCSCACSNTLFRSGLDHGNYKEMKTDYRSICFRHHKKQCIVCEEYNIVEVHHFDNNHENDEPSNLIPLCPTHHKYIHSRHKILIKDKVNDYHSKMVRVIGFEPMF